MPVTWLHVSDFHIREGDPYDRNVVLNALVASVRRLRENEGRAPDLIFATGDIAFSGKPAEYEMATRFFDELLDAAGVEREHLFVIPGNHDVDRGLGVGLARTLTTREEADAYFGPKVPKAHIKQKLGAFVKWHNKYFRGIRSTPTNTTCGPVIEVSVNGIRVGLLPVNSALFCEGDDDQSKLLIGRRALEPALKQLRELKADINIALIHHPLDWLSDVDRSNIRADLQVHVDVILRGHLHESDAEATVSAHGGFLHVAAGAAYQSRKWPNRALYGTFDGSEVTIFPIRYEDQPREVWVVDPSVFPEDARSGHAHTFAIPRLAAVRATAPVISRAAEPAASPIQQPSAHFRSNVQPRYHLPFVGRDALLAEIDAALADASAEAALVLHGEPGVGKSELAREYARRSRQRYPGGTFVVRAGGGNEPVELANLGRVLLGLDLPDGLSIQEQAERTLMSLGGSPVLLIYDNATGEDDIGKWLPPAGIPCHVLATSNSEAWSPGWRQLHVRRLPDDVSFDLIEKVGGKLVVERFGGDLVRVAEGLPIQLVPVATALAYAERRGRLDSERIEMAKEVRESFRVPYESLGDAERLLLHAAAYLNDQRIIRGELFRHLEAAVGWSDAEFRDRLDACLDLHVLEGNEELRMHQLFAAFVRSIPALPALGESLRAVRVAQRARLLEVATALDENPAQVDLAMVLNGFRLRPEDWIEEGSELSGDEGEVIGGALYETGKFDPARRWFERAVEEKRQGDAHGRVDHASLGRSLHLVGYCLSSVGKYDIAHPWFERAVEEAKRGDMHGRVDHTSLGRSLHLVGYCLSSVGKHEEAWPWYARAVEEKQQGDVHGRVDHASLGSSLHQVGYCLSSVGKYEEARPWYERAVEENEQGDMHGRVDHASLGGSLHQVSYCLGMVGKYEEARRWCERAVEERRQGDVHGRVNHEGLGKSLGAVGYCLLSVGKYEEAWPWYERAVEEAGQGDIFGRVNQASLRTILTVGAECLRKLGRTEEAAAWEAEAAKLDAG
jgi:tetratricopeptide (TPR) repeat protein/predicted phosphodiesterase